MAVSFWENQVNLDVLRRKNVLLLISSLDITQDELSVLEQSYNESRLHEMRLQSPYEVVWIPIVNQLTDVKQRHTTTKCTFSDEKIRH